MRAWPVILVGTALLAALAFPVRDVLAKNGFMSRHGGSSFGMRHAGSSFGTRRFANRSRFRVRIATRPFVSPFVSPFASPFVSPFVSPLVPPFVSPLVPPFAPFGSGFAFNNGAFFPSRFRGFGLEQTGGFSWPFGGFGGGFVDNPNPSTVVLGNTGPGFGPAPPSRAASDDRPTVETTPSGVQIVRGPGSRHIFR